MCSILSLYAPRIWMKWEFLVYMILQEILNLRFEIYFNICTITLNMKEMTMMELKFKLHIVFFSMMDEIFIAYRKWSTLMSIENFQCLWIFAFIYFFLANVNSVLRKSLLISKTSLNVDLTFWVYHFFILEKTLSVKLRISALPWI